MKIILNRGFSNLFTRLVVSKNGQEIINCSMKKDYCEFDTKIGDQIVINLRSLGYVPIASFVCNGESETYYISPTMFCRRWEFLSFKIFPYLTLILFGGKMFIESDLYDWLCAAMILLTVLSFIFIQSCPFQPFMWKKLFKVDKL